MKILQVMAGAEHGGAETAFVDMCIALHEAGEIIEVVTRPNKGRVPKLEAAGIKVHTLPFGGKVDVFTSWKLTKIIRDFQPDIVQTWLSRAAQKVPRWRSALKIPRYLIVARLGNYYKRRHFNTADYFVTITPDIRRHLIDNGVDENKVVHINNFAETEENFKPVKRSDFDTPDKAPLLLGLGRLHTAKAFDTMIKTLAWIPGVYLWIAGEGPQRKELEDLIASLDLGERVKLLGWRDDRAALLEACDICVFTSRYEGFGTVFVQAWAQKTPVIVSDAAGPKQFVRDGEDGLVVPIDDEGALKAAIERLVADRALARKLTENGYARYQAEFTREKCLQNYLQYYHDIRAREGF